MATLVDIEQLKRNIREIESSSVYKETSLAEEESKAFKKILKLASIREQASKKLHERLIKDGFSEQAVSNALGRATDAHIVDDERYAEAFMRTQLAQGKGRRGVERALEQLDIDSPSEEAWQLAYEQSCQKGYSADVAASAARRWSESLAAPECEYFAD